jgi:hypothetical protein
VEYTFSSLKTRGFNLERTRITQPKRLERLFKLTILTWINVLRVGIWLHEVKRIKVLAHGRKAMRLVRDGSERLEHLPVQLLKKLPLAILLLSLQYDVFLRHLSIEAHRILMSVALLSLALLAKTHRVLCNLV